MHLGFNSAVVELQILHASKKGIKKTPFHRWIAQMMAPFIHLTRLYLLSFIPMMKQWYQWITIIMVIVIIILRTTKHDYCHYYYYYQLMEPTIKLIMAKHTHLPQCGWMRKSMMMYSVDEWKSRHGGGRSCSVHRGSVNGRGRSVVVTTCPTQLAWTWEWGTIKDRHPYWWGNTYFLIFFLIFNFLFLRTKEWCSIYYYFSTQHSL